tara:strand:- start:304 stop:543 length:240 start_codon:yes stop_codon:yes gene_type:complete
MKGQVFITTDKDIWDFKIFSMAIVAAIWIYVRELDYYKALPEKDIKTSILIFIWAYLTLIEPYFLLVGLAILYNFGDRL